MRDNLIEAFKIIKLLIFVDIFPIFLIEFIVKIDFKNFVDNQLEIFACTRIYFKEKMPNQIKIAIV